MTMIDVLPPDPNDPDSPEHWTICGDLRLATPRGFDWIDDVTNRHAGRVVEERWPDVDHDGELSMVWLYTATEERAREVAAWLNDPANRAEFAHVW